MKSWSRTSEKLREPWRCQAKTVQYLALACPPIRTSMKFACRDLTPPYVSQNDEERSLEPPLHHGTLCLVHGHNPLSWIYSDEWDSDKQIDIMETHCLPIMGVR